MTSASHVFDTEYVMLMVPGHPAARVASRKASGYMRDDEEGLNSSKEMNWVMRLDRSVLISCYERVVPVGPLQDYSSWPGTMSQQ